MSTPRERLRGICRTPHAARDSPHAARRMTYSVKEIFYTLQGEGANTGRPAVFLRFAGCNLWTGRAEDRDRGPGGCSRWCDTDFVGTDGTGGGKFEPPAALLAAVSSPWPSGAPSPFVVCT